MLVIKNEMKFIFDALRHEYYLGEIRLPGTTELLRSAGIIEESSWHNEAALIRGRNVHKACQFYAEGDLDFDSLKPEIRGYVEAYDKAVFALNFYPEEIEAPCYHNQFLFATIPDQVGYYQKGDGNKYGGVLEIKSGVMQKWTAIQTALQVLARWPKDYLQKIRVGIELHSDGSFLVQHFTDYDDFGIAISLINIWHWKQKREGDKWMKCR